MIIPFSRQIHVLRFANRACSNVSFQVLRDWAHFGGVDHTICPTLARWGWCEKPYSSPMLPFQWWNIASKNLGTCPGPAQELPCLPMVIGRFRTMLACIHSLAQIPPNYAGWWVQTSENRSHPYGWKSMKIKHVWNHPVWYLPLKLQKLTCCISSYFIIFHHISSLGLRPRMDWLKVKCWHVLTGKHF